MNVIRYKLHNFLFMSTRKQRRQARRRRNGKKGFKIHAMNYLGVMGFLWFIWFFTSPGGYPWPVWPMAGWGLGLFFHYVGAVLAPRWGEEEDSVPQYQAEPSYQNEPQPFEEKISSEYRMDEVPSQSEHRSREESWDGVDVQVHDVDDRD